MAESPADDHQQAGSSSAAASSSTSVSSTPSQSTTTYPSSQTHSKLPTPNGTPAPSQPPPSPPQQTNGASDSPYSPANLTNGDSHREDAPGSPALNALPNGHSTTPSTSDTAATTDAEKSTPPEVSQGSDATTGENGPSNGEESETAPKGAEEASAEEEETKEPTTASKQKLGPSSDITAAEWDGGMAKEDVQDNLDDLENADSEPEIPDEKASDRQKLDKGKSPAHVVTKSNTAKPAATNPDKRKEKGKSLKLIDLPLDVLKEIVREVTNTTDLCSLCLSHSSLHALAIPLIYSRFDIVWPDQNVSSDRTGVDALTYGLATLVSNENDYAQYVRKFSLGNGPKEWVGEYAINKESGKMLGTLVGLAVWKMGMLETFSWDMPTGILRDVWRALHRLKSLRNIHVRWHDNTQVEVVGSQDGSRKIERPTFSGFKDLKSLSVLDLDELTYLREMAVAVQRSFGSLRELRLGVAVHSQSKRWVHDDVETITPDTHDGAGEGGAIGILVGKICDFNRRAAASALPTSQEVTTDNALTQEQLAQILQGQQQSQQPNLGDADNATSTSSAGTANTAIATVANPVPPAVNPSPRSKKDNSEPSKQLRLETLELERVPISTRVLTKAIEFSYLTNLTLLNCGNQSKLFKALKRKYSPYPANVLAKLSKLSLTPSSSSLSKPPFHVPPPNYRLRLKKVHTDMVSTSLIEFLHQTLAPNTLETLFLQEASGDSYISSVDLTQIVTDVLRRHRLSLQRLLIDSYVQNPDIPSEQQLNLQNINNRKSKWRFNQETISFVTEMPRLRELAFGIDYTDWHYMITRLPDMRSLKSLYIPHIIGGIDFHKVERQSEELAMSIVDVVTLRPECAICYVGIVNKCFELLEGEDGSSNDHDHGAGDNGVGTDEEDDEDASDEDDGMDDGNEDDGSDDGNETEDADEVGSDAGGSPLATSAVLLPLTPFGPAGEDEEEVSSRKKRVSIRQREILFYDDKVAVFKARFARL
ncbi:hypothetical protein DRE_04001 [Drechslerella stenobrocha 248]|uniref:F-box domain-containing protein n=1 Tax=Drechslerella stenobrocha 248 TaxID=1043628 RepID=W7HRS5_9PEZI|nr:hypothetical protein DRE_04001 [Drechslerella stenobrocha 248]